MRTEELGRTGRQVTPICIGTSPLGSFPAQYGYEVPERQAVDTILNVLDSPVRFIDTSNNYFEAERRIGMAIQEYGGLPDDVLIGTKIDPNHGSDDFSGARARISVQESLDRLGLDHLPLVYLHDPEIITWEQATGDDGPVQALVAMQREGLITHIGVAGGPIDLMQRFLALDLFQVVISHNRYTLVDQSATPLIEDAAARGVGFVNAAPYGGGMLVRGPDQNPNYAYSPASQSVRDRVRSMQTACTAHGVPLAAAALQFSTRHDHVASTIVGMSSPERISRTIELYDWDIPSDLWAQLDDLAAPGRVGVL